jgi:hypothetical protein
MVIKSALHMKKIIMLYMLVLTGTFAVLTSCDKKVNDWPVDPSYERLFRPLVFNAARVGATEVDLRYTQVVAADRYIFEFSKDESFIEIEKSVEILADTLTPFAPSTSPARVEYRTTFDELDGNTQYYVRMKGVDLATGQESRFSQISLLTSAEQLFNRAEVFVDRIIMHWPPTDRVTHVSIIDPVTMEELRRVNLSENEKLAGQLEITGLSPGKNYRLTINNDEVVRGTSNVKTSGIDGGVIIRINPGDDIAALVSASVAESKPNVILMFSGDVPYILGTLTLPAGVDNVSITGESNTDGNKPILNISALRFTNTVYGAVVFENVDIVAPSGSGFLATIDQTGSLSAGYSFVNCRISGFGNGIVRLNGNVNVDHVIFENCWINGNGGWGVVNVGGASVTLQKISFTNSTLLNLATQLMDVRTAVADIIIENCTFYNQTTAMTQLLRLDGPARPGIGRFSLGNNIFAGNNSNAPITAVGYNPHTLSFAGSYKTNDLSVTNANRGFTDITVFDGSSADLFVDPVNNDFSIKPGNGFGGRGTAGDPRWFD